MAYLARQVGGGFVAGNKLFASQLNSELDHLIGAFVGTDNRNIKLKYNDSDEPTLALWNSGGSPLEISVGGGEDLKLSVSSTGVLVSAVSTGASPFQVASTTVVANLNADTIDGHELAALIQTDVASQTITHASSEVNLKLVPTGQGADAGSARIYLDVRDTDQNVDAMWRISVLGSDDTFRVQQWDDSETGYLAIIQANVADPSPYFKVWDEALGTPQQVATTKSRTIAQIGAFYEGVISTGAKQATFLASDDVEELILTIAKYVFRGGTATDDTLISIKTWSDADPPVEQQEVVLTIVEEDTADVTYTVDITDIEIEPGESLTWECTQSGIHEDISIWLVGEQEIRTG